MLFEIKDLKVGYESGIIVKGVSLNVNEGEIVCLIGSNGAGKTTILRSISGLVPPVGGEILFEGQRVDQLSPQEIVKAGIAQVAQGRNLFPFMTVRENLGLGAYLRNDKAGINADLEKIYDHFPILKQRSNQMASTMSGGEQQMTAIACALMSRPRLLLLDEPSLGLSPIMVQEISKIIRDINRDGTSILWVEQNVQLALNIARRGYVMETGNIVLEGDAADLLDNKHVKKAYLG